MSNPIASNDASVQQAPERKTSFDHADLIACGEGRLYGAGFPKLPLAPMLMFDRIPSIDPTGGDYAKGSIIAELDVNPDLWFFPCHFQGDNVMPGCLGLDALWQLTGFFVGWSGVDGKGRAFGVDKVRFSGQVTPESRLVRYGVSIKKISKVADLTMCIADGWMENDGDIVYKVSGMRVGVVASSA